MPTPSKPRSRWFQYSLRTLLVLMLLACIGIRIGVKIQRGRKERAGAEAIERLSGSVFWMHPDSLGESRRRAWLRKLFEDDCSAYPDRVVIRNDAAMGYLTELARTPKLDLNGIRVTDAGLAHLQGLTQLKHIAIEHTRVTDAGLAYVQGLTQLRELSLEDTQVTDAGLVYLQGLARLEVLSLNRTRVTDAGLAHLQELTQLQVLKLGGTQVTDAGSEEVRQPPFGAKFRE